MKMSFKYIDWLYSFSFYSHLLTLLLYMGQLSVHFVLRCPLPDCCIDALYTCVVYQLSG